MVKKIIITLAFSAVLLFAAGSAGPVPYYGRMKAEGNKLIGENTNSPVQVRGMSFFWSCPEWESGKFAPFWSAATVDAMVDGWNAEILRAAMAANNEGGCGDYQNNKQQTLQMLKTVVNRAIERDIYVIIDWHSHKAHQQQTEAINFFVNEMAEYHNKPHVIFEIYNEPPDGDANQWATIKPYMQAVVTAIRAKANNLILVGTPYYDQDPDLATANPIIGDDLAYVLHFYAAEHKLDSRTIGSWRFNNENKTFRNVSLKALGDGFPLFVSEYGSVWASGDGNVDDASTNAWHNFMDEHKISSCKWAINNKSEGASAFVSNFTVPASGSAAAWTNTNNMTASGKYIYNKLAEYATTAEWRFNEPPPVSISSKPIASHNIFVASNSIIMQISDAAELRIFNLQGSLVHKVNLEKGSHAVSLSGMPKGLYIAKVSINNQQKQVLNVPIR